MQCRGIVATCKRSILRLWQSRRQSQLASDSKQSGRALGFIVLTLHRDRRDSGAWCLTPEVRRLRCSCAEAIIRYAPAMATITEVEKLALGLPDSERAKLATHLPRSLPPVLLDDDDGDAEAFRDGSSDQP